MVYFEEKSKGLLERVEALKLEWKRLWNERLDDKVRAEGIANETYSSLCIEKGTVVFATRNFKVLTFTEILEEHGITEAHRFVSPNPRVGGWGKFVKDQVLSGKSHHRRRTQSFVEEEKKAQQLKKGGRGWLHL